MAIDRLIGCGPAKAGEVAAIRRTQGGIEFDIAGAIRELRANALHPTPAAASSRRIGP